MRITFDPGARADLDDIFAWISEKNESAAYAMIGRIEAKIALLATPGLEHMGRSGFAAARANSSNIPISLCTKCRRAKRKLLCGRSFTAPRTASAKNRDRILFLFCSCEEISKMLFF